MQDNIMTNTVKKFKSIRKSNKIKDKMLKSSFWMGLGSGSEQLVRLVKNMILTKILAPEYFAVMAIILTVNMLFESMTEVGIKEAIVQSDDGKDLTYLNGAFVFSLIRTVILYLILFVSAPFIADFYNNSNLSLMMRIAFISFFFNGLISMKSYVLVKEMKFKEWVIIEYGSKILGTIFTIIIAVILKDAWALVLGFTVEYFLRFIFSYILCPYFPTFELDRAQFNALMKYARGIFGLPALNLLFMRLDIFVLGKMSTPAILGIYSMGVALARAPTAMLSKVISTVMMPSFSQIQDEKEKISELILNVTKLLSYICFPLIVYMSVFSTQLLSFIYTEEYAIIHIAFIFFLAAYLLRSISVVIASVFLAIGQPESLRFFTIIRALIIAVIIFPLTKYMGFVGTSLSVFLSMLISYVLQIGKLKHTIGLSFAKYSLSFFSGFYSIIPVFLSYFLTRHLGLSDGISLLIGLAGMGLSFLIAGLWFYRKKKSAPTARNAHERT